MAVAMAIPPRAQADHTMCVLLLTSETAVSLPIVTTDGVLSWWDRWLACSVDAVVVGLLCALAWRIDGGIVGNSEYDNNDNERMTSVAARIPACLIWCAIWLTGTWLGTLRD